MYIEYTLDFFYGINCKPVVLKMIQNGDIAKLPNVKKEKAMWYISKKELCSSEIDL